MVGGRRDNYQNKGGPYDITLENRIKLPVYESFWVIKLLASQGQEEASASVYLSKHSEISVGLN